MAVPCGFPLFVHLRRRAGPLLLAAARVSGDSAGGLHGRAATARILDEEGLRAAMHGFVRASDFGGRSLARAAEIGRWIAGGIGIAGAADPSRRARLIHVAGREAPAP